MVQHIRMLTAPTQRLAEFFLSIASVLTRLKLACKETVSGKTSVSSSVSSLNILAKSIKMDTRALMLFPPTSRLVKLVTVLLVLMVSLLVLCKLDEPVIAAMAAREAALQAAAERQQELVGVKLTNWLWRRSWLVALRPREVQDHRLACPAPAPTLLQHVPLLGRVVVGRRHQLYVSCMEALLQQGTEAAACWYLLCVTCCLLGGLLLQVLARRHLRGCEVKTPALPPERVEDLQENSASSDSMEQVEERLRTLLLQDHGPSNGSPPPQEQVASVPDAKWDSSASWVLRLQK